jgi:hypothetical protein
MSESEPRSTRYLGTFFDPDTVLKVSRWADILSWVVVVVYAADLLLAIIVFILQFARGFMVGLGVTDFLNNIVYIVERPFRGIVYFVALQAISKALLILMDMEADMRRAGRK